MLVLDAIETLKLLCKSTNKWGMLISTNSYGVSSENYITELCKAAPYLDISKHTQVILDKRAYILVESKEELDTLYHQTVGDDGPTAHNPYNGPIKVYALTCNSDGQTLNENT